MTMKKHSGPVGGFFFFLSLLSVGTIGVFNWLLVAELLRIHGSSDRLVLFGSGVLSGIVLCLILIRGHISVFVHELKHSVVSNLVGNKSRGMQINRESGHFEYEYSSETAKHNALIQSAPYWLPLFTLVAFPVSIFIAPPEITVIVLGASYGADVYLGASDIGPYQTDLTGIRGGFGVGLIFVLAMNSMISSFVVLWALGGNPAVFNWGRALWFFVRRLASY